ELDILSKITPDTPEVINAGMVEVANHIRNVFKGNDPKVQLGVTLSTRTLCRWARMTVDFRSAANPLAYALDQALLRRANPEERTAILRICKDVFGDQWQ